MSCCIIGGTGFIGHHLVTLLSKQRDNLLVIGRSKTPSRELPKNVDYIIGDYGDPSFLNRILRDVDEIIDLSYASIPKTSFEDPINDILINLPSHVNLFEVASKYNIKKIIFVSSGGTIYGKTNYSPITEQYPTYPISPYGITKLVVEKYAIMYHLLKALPIICVRPANAYGVGQTPFIGQGFVATAIASVLQGKEIIIYGENGVVRDYIYVDDVVNGIVAALNSKKNGEIYNIGTGIGYSNNNIIDKINFIAKSKNLVLKIKHLPPRDFDVPVNILDSTKLIIETGWNPTINIEAGLEKTWYYYENLFK